MTSLNLPDSGKDKSKDQTEIDKLRHEAYLRLKAQLRPHIEAIRQSQQVGPLDFAIQINTK